VRESAEEEDKLSLDPSKCGRVISQGTIFSDLIRSAIPENPEDALNKSPAGETAEDVSFFPLLPEGDKADAEEFGTIDCARAAAAEAQMPSSPLEPVPQI
jgi:hypothetical protein